MKLRLRVIEPTELRGADPVLAVYLPTFGKGWKESIMDVPTRKPVVLEVWDEYKGAYVAVPIVGAV